MTFIARKIEGRITLGVGQFGATKGDTVRLTGLRMSVAMHSYGKDSMGAMQIGTELEPSARCSGQRRSLHLE